MYGQAAGQAIPGGAHRRYTSGRRADPGGRGEARDAPVPIRLRLERERGGKCVAEPDGAQDDSADTHRATGVLGAAMRTTGQLCDELGRAKKPIRIDLDSGAEVNVIAERTADRAVTRGWVTKVPITLPRLLGVDGQPLRCYGAVEAAIEMQDM